MGTQRLLVKGHPRWKRTEKWFEVECCFRSWHLPYKSCKFIDKVYRLFPEPQIDWTCPKCSKSHKVSRFDATWWSK